MLVELTNPQFRNPVTSKESQIHDGNPSPIIQPTRVIGGVDCTWRSRGGLADH